MSHKALYLVSTSGPELSVPHPNPASTYLFVTLAQQSLEKQHQLGEGGPNLKLLFPALLHDLIAGERGTGVRVSGSGSATSQNKGSNEELGGEGFFHYCTCMFPWEALPPPSVQWFHGIDHTLVST